MCGSGKPSAMSACRNFCSRIDLSGRPWRQRTGKKDQCTNLLADMTRVKYTCTALQPRSERRLHPIRGTHRSRARQIQLLFHKMPRLVALVLVSAAVRMVVGIWLGAPGSCGGVRVVPHTHALFGPPLGAPARARPVFAPARCVGCANLADACAPLDMPMRLAARDHVVLVARGACDFAQKTAVVQEAGALGVIIVNGPASSPVTSMKFNDSLVSSGNAPSIRIPTAMIEFSEWARFARCRDSPLLTITMTHVGQAVNDIDEGRHVLVWAVMIGMVALILVSTLPGLFRRLQRLYIKPTDNPTVSRQTSSEMTPLLGPPSPPKIEVGAHPLGGSVGAEHERGLPQ